MHERFFCLENQHYQHYIVSDLILYNRSEIRYYLHRKGRQRKKLTRSDSKRKHAGFRLRQNKEI